MKLKHTKVAALTATLITFGSLAGGANAATLFNNGSGLNATGYFADTTFNSVVADDFVLGGAATVASLAWTGTYFSNNVAANPDGFQVYFFNDAGGIPGALISMQTVSVSRVDSGLNDTDFGLDIYSYSANITPVALAAGTYWLGLMNDTTTTSASWLWAGGPQSFGAASRRSGNGGLSFTFLDFTPQKNFVLSGTAVPEPSSSLLIGLGALGLVARRRRIK